MGAGQEGRDLSGTAGSEAARGELRRSRPGSAGVVAAGLGTGEGAGAMLQCCAKILLTVLSEPPEEAEEVEEVLGGGWNVCGSGLVAEVVVDMSCRWGAGLSEGLSDGLYEGLSEESEVGWAVGPGEAWW